MMPRGTPDNASDAPEALAACTPLATKRGTLG